MIPQFCLYPLQCARYRQNCVIARRTCPAKPTYCSMFLIAEDYLAVVKDNILISIIENDVATRETAELAAHAEIESYLAARYDTAAVFAAVGTARNAMIVRSMVDVSLYHLYARLSPDQVPAFRKERYEQVIAYLKMVAKQQINPSLPEPEDKTKEEVRYGSNPARGNRY